MSSVLDKDFHSRLLQDIDNVANRAGIPVHMIHKSSAEYLTTVEIEYLSEIKEQHLNDKFGMVVGGKVTGSIQLKFMAMAAMMVRNYIDGAVLTLADVLAHGSINPQVLFVPNFYTTTEGKPLTGWQIQELQSTLTRRMVEAKQTVVYVSDMHMMKMHYGEAIESLLVNNYEYVTE